MANKFSGMLASVVVKVALDKLVTALGDPAAGTMPDENLRRHIEELKQRMEAMAEVAGDVETRSIVEEEAQEWLIRLEDAAYGIWDMVDELQANQWKPVTEVHCPCLRIATARKGKMESMMNKAKQKLDGLLQTERQGKHWQSVDDDAHTITTYFNAGWGDEDKYELMDTILSAVRDTSRGLFIVAIVGVGGMGKTTLANMVFSDATNLISDYARARVTVSRHLDLKYVGNAILSQLSNKMYQDSSDVELIMKRLDDFLAGGNKALIVLDDLWSYDISDLEGLRRMLGAGKEGSKVIVMVTTRNEGVAKTLGSDYLHRIPSRLSRGESLLLLKQKVGFATRPDDDARLELEQLLHEIAIKCHGVPLLINALGSTMRPKSPEEIRSVLNSDNWKWEGEEDTWLLPALLASYQLMPPNLRLCFAYCAIFPRGHNILKDDLIHHWIALQLLESSHTLSATQLANRYIDMLLDMSFLRRSMQPSDHGCAVSFTLHGVAHDLAMQVSSETLIVLDSTNSYQRFSSQKNRYRQAWLTNSGVSGPGNLSDILSARLGVLLFHGCSHKQLSDDSFSSAKYLRVLDLRDSWLQKLPDSICQLRQLRYLNLSGSTSLVSLPDLFGILKKLGHIDLSSCSGLSKLPPSFGNLTSVMHINLSGCVGLKSLTESFGNLTNVVHVNLSGCVGLKSLPESFGLLEKLEYLDLSSCSCLEGIQSALGRLTNLHHLNLSHPCCYLGKQGIHLDVPKDIWDKLIYLRYLNLSMCLNPILCYLPVEERNKYIVCISGLRSLEHLDLSHNIFLFDIPRSLGQLSQLQTLNLFGCARLERIEKWMGESNFPKKCLVVSNCLGLKTYQFVVRTDGKSSNLSQLKDVSCKELEISCLENVISTEEAQSIRLTEKKKLQKLTLVWSAAHDDVSFKDHEALLAKLLPHEALLAKLVPPKNLQYFQLHGYRSQHLPTWLTSSIFSHLPNLVEVTMVDIPSCCNLPPFGVLPNLQRLIVRKMAKITRIDAGCLSGGSKAAFLGLLHVTLDGMLNLEQLVMFPTLYELVINSCPKIRFGGSPPKAQMLVISDCDQLMPSPVKRRGYNAVEDPSSSTSTAITCGPVTEVVIESCEVPLDKLNWSLLQGLEPLHSLHIRNCSEKIISPEIMKEHLSSLKLLCFSHCDSMTNLPEHVVQDTLLQEIVIHECHGIKSLPQSICEEKKKHYPHLRIRQCPELEKWCDGLEENKRKLAREHIIFEGYVPGVTMSLTDMPLLPASYRSEVVRMDDRRTRLEG